MEKIIKRDIIDEIAPYLDDDSIIVLHGARQVGKTHILYYLQNSLQASGKLTRFIDLEDSRQVAMLDGGADSLLDYLKNDGIDTGQLMREGKSVYVFVDEIQYLRNPSSLLKLLADHHKYLRLIVSGSSSFDIKRKFKNSLVGRTVNFEVFNLSFKEFIRFKGREYDLRASLSELFFQKTVAFYQEYLFYGGYPKIVLENVIAKKEKHLQQIIDTYVRKDVRDLAGVQNVAKFNAMLTVLAGQAGQLLNVAELAGICGLARQTVEHYLFILENTYVIKLVRPFSNSAKVAVVKAPKIFFYDTGLLQILRAKQLTKEWGGHLLETNIFAELCKKFGADNINFWRSRAQAEIDFIVNIKGKILPIEVKQNFRNFKKAAMLAFCEKFKIKDYRLVAVDGAKIDAHSSYPWEL